MLHLGMSGSLRVLPQGTAPLKHDHVDILLDSGKVLRYRDPSGSDPLLSHSSQPPFARQAWPRTALG